MNEVKKKHVILGLCAVAIAVVFFFAGFGTGYGVGKGADPAPALTTESGGMVIASDDSDGADKNVSLTAAKIERTEYDEYGIMPIAEEAYTVTATVSGDGLTADQKNVTWSAAAFKDPSSSWATGKSVSDYVTTSPNGNQLTVQCLKPFGEQIIIKCTSSFNTAVSKDLTVDYKEKIESIGLVVQFENSINKMTGFVLGKNTTANWSWIFDGSLNTSFIGKFSKSSASTIAAEVVTFKFTFGMNESFFNELTQSGLGDYLIEGYKQSLSCLDDSEFIINSDSKNSFVSRSFLTSLWLDDLFSPGVLFKPAQVDTAKQKFLELFEQQVPFLDLYVTVGDKAPALMGHVAINPDTYRDWLQAQASVSGIDFNEYNDGMIFNQD